MVGVNLKFSCPKKG